MFAVRLKQLVYLVNDREVQRFVRKGRTERKSEYPLAPQDLERFIENLELQVNSLLQLNIFVFGSISHFYTSHLHNAG